MKKQILSFSLALLALTALTGNSSAQGYEHRVDAARVAAQEGRSYRPDHDNWNRGDGNRRAFYDLDRLNREVRSVRLAIGDSRRRHIRDRFRRVVKATDNLNYQFRRGNIRGWEVRRQVEEIRSELERIRWELRRR